MACGYGYPVFSASRNEYLANHNKLWFVGFPPITCWRHKLPKYDIDNIVIFAAIVDVALINGKLHNSIRFD